MNETDVREMIVRPLIERLGYRHGTEATILTEKTLRYEQSFLGRKNPKKDPALQGRADYICEVTSFGRWVVEVKAPSEELTREIAEQAHTYAAHPEVGAELFMITNGRRFKVFETGKLERAAMEWNYEDQDDNLLRLFNLLSPDALRQRARRRLVDPGEPLGKGLASRLRIAGGEVMYEEHKASHPILQNQSFNGLALPVTGGMVSRDAEGRIRGTIKIAKAVPLIRGLNTEFGASDVYDFCSSAKYLSDDPQEPNIFQSTETVRVPMGTILRIPGIPASPMPFAMNVTTYTEAIGFVDKGKLAGTMKLSYEFQFGAVAPQTRQILAPYLGSIPESAIMTGMGRFEVFLQPDI